MADCADLDHWPQGEAEIDGILECGEPERVEPSGEHADLLVDQAVGHLSAARSFIDQHPPSSLALTYDAPRKAMTAARAQQGLRPTTTGGHLAVQEALEAQLGPNVRHTLRPFRMMRRRRNESEYPRISEAPATVSETRRPYADATAIVEQMKKFRQQVGPW